MDPDPQRAPSPGFYQRMGQRYPDFLEAVERLGAAASSAGPLDDLTLQYVQLGAAAAERSEGAVHSHTRRALAAGASPEAIRHALISLTSTIGFPNVMAALSWAEDQLERSPAPPAP